MTALCEDKERRFPREARKQGTFYDPLRLESIPVQRFRLNVQFLELNALLLEQSIRQRAVTRKNCYQEAAKSLQ